MTMSAGKGKEQENASAKHPLVLVLIATPPHPAAGQDGTGAAPTVVQAVNAKYADPKPCSNGWHATLDAAGNPVNSPGAEATGKKPQVPGYGAPTGVIPAVPVNPPTVIVPPSQPEPMSLRYVAFEIFFYTIGANNLSAEQADKAGKHAEAAGGARLTSKCSNSTMPKASCPAGDRA